MLAVGRGDELGVEQIGSDGVGERHVGRGNLDIVEAGNAALAARDQRRLVGEGLFMREQHALVGDRNDVVVERAGGDRLFRLLDEDRPLGIEPVQPGDRLRRLEVLARREGAARHAIDEDLDPRLAVAGASRMWFAAPSSPKAGGIGP